MLKSKEETTLWKSIHQMEETLQTAKESIGVDHNDLAIQGIHLENQVDNLLQSISNYIKSEGDKKHES